MANRPVYSYKLSILHFWSLIFLYIWAGPHHLLYTSLPDWAQSLGTVFSIMLIAPSWGGMINGLLTLRGAWDKVREDASLKMMVVGITAYGMATFEGPLLSLKNVNAIAHYTDWIPAHVHVGALGWNGFSFFCLHVLYDSQNIWKGNFLQKIDEYAFLVGYFGYTFLGSANVYFWVHTRYDVERIYRRRQFEISEFFRNYFANYPNVLFKSFGRIVLFGRCFDWCV